MTRLDAMLEQHNHYDMGDGFTIQKTADEWCIYYEAKHVDTYDRPNIQPGELTSYCMISSAIKAVNNLRQSAEWYKPNKELSA